MIVIGPFMSTSAFVMIDTGILVRDVLHFDSIEKGPHFCNPFSEPPSQGHVKPLRRYATVSSEIADIRGLTQFLFI
jgi:hypothetical protein